jgi:hypothetical protein
MKIMKIPKTTMKRLVTISILLSCILSACGPARAAAPRPDPSPTITQPTAAPGEATPTPQIPPTIAAGRKAESTPTRQAQPTAIAPNKGKNPSPASADSRFVATEILGRPTSTSITANLVAAVPVETHYEYGTEPGVYAKRTVPQTAAAGEPLETLLDGLQPDTRYYYRLRYGDEAGQESSFVTQRAPGSTFSFAIQGDSHPERLGKQFDPALYNRTLLSAAAARPDFYLTIGDDFGVDNLKTVNAQTVEALYANQRSFLAQVAAPVFLVNGNHEQASLANLDGTANNVAVWAQTARNAYFPQPAPDGFYTGDAKPVAFIGQLRDYYAYTWGDALFVVIDPYWHSTVPVDNVFGGGSKARDMWGITLGEDQYQWFKRTLETSQAKYKFVFAHHVNGTGRGGIEVAGTFEWGNASQFAAHRPGWTATIHQLMVDNHVSVFFQGHDHIFVRQELDGVIYQTLPEPANPFYTAENEDAYLSGDKLPNSGYVRVTVAPDQAKVEYVRCYLPKDEVNGHTTGEIAFSYAVKPGGGVGK